MGTPKTWDLYVVADTDLLYEDSWGMSARMLRTYDYVYMSTFTLHRMFFVAVKNDGAMVTWGYAEHGGDSTGNSCQLVDVQDC